MRLLVDGVRYQVEPSGRPRLWLSILSRLINRSGVEVFLLDRGNLPEFPGATIIPFPAYTDRYTADDSFLLQKMCDFYAIDVFTSTQFTSPVRTPALLIVEDMSPEVFGIELEDRLRREREVAISFARAFLAVSNTTKSDLLSLYPEIPDELVTVVHRGVDRAIFAPADRASVEAFRREMGFERPYFLLVAARELHKNANQNKLFFDAFCSLDAYDIDVLWMDGEEGATPPVARGLPRAVRVASHPASDRTLVLAYNGALALVHPSLSDGLEEPVLEAMACGCPVIITTRGGLTDSERRGCITVEPDSLPQMIAALEAIQDESKRLELMRAGLLSAQEFDWDTMVDTLEAQLDTLVARNKAGEFEAFFDKWQRLRALQSSVDEQTLG
jgi:glycosyltransferase involved in cell wall biosynthesis